MRISRQEMVYFRKVVKLPTGAMLPTLLSCVRFVRVYDAVGVIVRCCLLFAVR
jgi:hypothetical protein